MPVVIPVIWYTHSADNPNRGFWDQGWLEEIFSGAWPAPFPVTFVHRYGFDGFSGSGAIVIIPARHYTHAVEHINACIAPLSWVMLILTGDEEASFPVASIVHPNMSLWVQTPHPIRHSSITNRVPDFSPPSTREFYADIAPDRTQTLAYSLVAQNNNLARAACFSVLDSIDVTPRFILPTPGFTLGMPRETYLAVLAFSRVAPSPSGPFTPDTFRTFEALDAGVIPVVDDTAPNDGATSGYWSFLFDEPPPFPVISSWSEFPDAFASLDAAWPASANEVIAWWIGYKRRFVQRFYDELIAVSSIVPSPSPITVIITSSPIPYHPDSSILETTLASITHRLPDSPIILCLDGVREEQSHLRDAYEEYQRRILFTINNLSGRITPIRFSAHTHQAAMTRVALSHVRTPQILFVEHDTPLSGDIPFPQLSSVIASGDLSLIRLYHEASIPPEHDYLMLDPSPTPIRGIPLIRTKQWSQRPHLASTAYYRRIIDAHFSPTERAMIEDRMHGIVQSYPSSHPIAIYAPHPMMKRSEHLDGRGTEPKWV